MSSEPERQAVAPGADDGELRSVVEVVLLASDRPVTLDDLANLVEAERGEKTDRRQLRASLRQVLDELGAECEGRGVELREVAGGYRYQVRPGHARWVARFFGERPARYSRALLETLALIAYRQPVTRGEIEEVRGVGVSASIMRILHEREWIRVVAHREVPGRPALFGTTSKFLEDFGLSGLDQLPPLEEIRNEITNGAPIELMPAAGGGNTGVSDELGREEDGAAGEERGAATNDDADDARDGGSEEDLAEEGAVEEDRRTVEARDDDGEESGRDTGGLSGETPGNGLEAGDTGNEDDAGEERGGSESESSIQADGRANGDASGGSDDPPPPGVAAPVTGGESDPETSDP